MTVPPCTQCGAALSGDVRRECPYCGTAFSIEVRQAVVESAGAMARAEREAPHVRPHRLEILTQELPPGGTARLDAAKFFTGISAVMFVPFLCAFNVIPAWLVPLGFVFLGVRTIKREKAALRAFAEDEVRRVPVRVLEERTEVAGRRRSTRTSYFVTLETSDGTRHEYQADGELAGLVTSEDVGVAFVRDRYLLDFVRVES